MINRATQTKPKKKMGDVVLQVQEVVDICNVIMNLAREEGTQPITHSHIQTLNQLRWMLEEQVKRGVTLEQMETPHVIKLIPLEANSNTLYDPRSPPPVRSREKQAVLPLPEFSIDELKHILEVTELPPTPITPLPKSPQKVKAKKIRKQKKENDVSADPCVRKRTKPVLPSTGGKMKKTSSENKTEQLNTINDNLNMTSTVDQDLLQQAMNELL